MRNPSPSPAPGSSALAHEQLRLLARGKNALPDGQLHIKEWPHAENILQRPPGGALTDAPEKRARGLLPRLLTAAENEALPVQTEIFLKNADRIKGRAFNPGLHQLAPARAVCLFQRHLLPPTISSPFSGMTSFMAAMATSIIESSGSCVVIRCIQSPGAAMIRVAQLSYRPQMRISS